jgi:hypothetical protein
VVPGVAILAFVAEVVRRQGHGQGHSLRCRVFQGEVSEGWSFLKRFSTFRLRQCLGRESRTSIS